MTTPREYAVSATAALRGMLPLPPVGFDEAGVLDIIEQAVSNATQARKKEERKRAAEVEAAAQKRMERLLSCSPAVVYSFAARDDFGPIFVSENLERVFGYEPREYMEDGSFWRDRVHPDDLDRVEAEVSRLFGNGTHSLEYRFLRKDGSYCWVSDQQHLIRDENGEALEVVGSWSDITERREAEAAKDAAHARLSNLLAASPAVIYSFEARGDYRPTYVSENIKEVLGYEPSQYLEEPDFWRQRVHPDDLAEAEGEFGQLLETGRHTVSYRFLKPDGDYRWVNDEWLLVRSADGEPLEIIGSWTDITGRKQAETAAAAMRDRTKRLLARAPAVIYAFRASGDFSPTFISKNVRKLLGYEPSEYLTDANFWLSRVHPEDLPRVTAEFPRLFEQDRLSYEYRFRRGDGTYCWVGDLLHLIRNDAGEPVEVVGSWSDITARKQAEAARLESEQRLIDAIESIGEGFAFYDTDDRLVISNTRYRKMLRADGIDELAPGTQFESIVRMSAANGGIQGSSGANIEEWIEDRLRQHLSPGDPVVMRQGDGRWIQVSERRASLGGTVAVHTDITELKENEERIARAHRFMLESVRYASRIQSAMMPNLQALARSMQDNFLIWEPRDIVGGDFFWFHPTDRGYFVILGDCTGHGVPGAFMTLIACGLLDRHLRTFEKPSPGPLLSMIHRDLQTMLGQSESDGDTDDGFEGGVCFVDNAERKLVFAGAHFSLWRAEHGTVEEIKGGRVGIGYRRLPVERSFAEATFAITDGQAFYMTTDGLLEQVGGINRRCFGRKRFVETVTAGFGRSMADQRDCLVAALSAHQGQESRRDDVTVLGFIP